MAAADHAERRYAGSLVVAGATARDIRRQGVDTVTLVASRGDHEEDVACARLLDALLRGEPAPQGFLDALCGSERYHSLVRGENPGFPPSDCELALLVDRFDFAMPVGEDDLGIKVVAERMQQAAVEPAR
jgi:phosphosulfolactate phosphohydrolase-like enzyme